MAVAHTSLTITMATLTPEDDDDAFLEAEIDSDDNEGVSTYYPGEIYKYRLYQALNIASVTFASSQGAVTLGSEKSESRPKPNKQEWLTFSGSREGSLSKPAYGGFSGTAMGKIYDLEGAVTSASLTSTNGSKKVIASKEIFGVFEVKYTTKYKEGTFAGSTEGPMLVFFIGKTS